MARRNGDRPKTEASGRSTGATCESVGCPVLKGGSRDLCKGCPGPAFFLGHHSCHNCLLRRKDGKPDCRCIICPGPSDEPNHKGASHVSIDAMPDGGEKVLEGRLDLSSAPASIRLSPDDADKARATMRFYTSLDEITFGYVRGALRGGELMALYDVSAEKKAALETAGKFASPVERRVSDFFVSMTQDEFSIVKHLLGGGNLNTYATVYNTKRQYAFEKMMSLMRRCLPELRSIVKERKQPNGRVIKKKAASSAQLEMNL